MNHRRFALTAAGAVILALFGPRSIVVADEPATEVPASLPTPVAKTQVEKTPTMAAAQVKVAPTGKPAHLPVYVEDWGHLADLTREDPLIFPRSEFWAKRREQTSSILAGGLIVGGGAVALGLSDWLTDGDWSHRARWSVVGGAGVVLVSYFVAWAFGPDRDDLLTVINQWNLRHSDRPLAP
jgi:hypothetical protein